MSWLDRILNRRPAPQIAPQARSDATQTPRQDGAVLENYLSGLGGSRDKGASVTITGGRRLSLEELADLYDGSGAWRRLAGLLPTFALYRGITIDDATDEVNPLADRLTELDALAKVRDAAALGAALGCAAVLMVADDAATSGEELDPATVRRVHALHVVDPRELSPISWDRELKSATHGQVLTWRWQPRRAGASLGAYIIHTSRLLWFYGEAPTPAALQATERPGLVGISRLQIWWEALLRKEQISTAGATAAQELSVSVFKLSDTLLRAGADSTYLEYVQLINRMKSLINGVLLAPGDEYSRQNVAITGFEGLQAAAVEDVVLVTGYPLPLLYGQAPAGLSTDGESWWRNWAGQVEDHQINRLTKPLTKLASCLYAEVGEIPKFTINFNPLGTPTAKELAEIRQINTAADSQAIMDGVLDVEHARLRYAGREGYTAVLPPRPEDLETAPPDDAMAEAMREQKDADFTGKALLSVRLSEAGRAAWSELVRAAELITGALEGYAPGEAGVMEAPHVTVLYLGAVASEAVPDIEARAQAIAEQLPPFALPVRRLCVLPAGPASEGRIPVVAEIDAWELRELNGALLRTLAHHVTAEQFPTFRAHVTLGFAREIGGEELAKLAEVPTVRDEERITLGSAGAIELSYGNEVWASLPLLGKRAE